MTPKQETRTAIVFAAIIFALIALTFVGCKTPKTVTETITEYVHDTVTVHKTDTVRESETHTYTVNEAGDTIKEVHLVKEKEIYHHTIEERTLIVDSTNRYKSVVDSLSKVVNELKNHEKVVVKTKYLIKWWEWVIFAAIFLWFAAMAIKNKSTSKSS